MNYRKLTTGLLLAAMMTATGCIKEDLDDCRNVAIDFRYVADGQENVLRQYIGKIDLYVFDGNNRLVDVVAYDASMLDNPSEEPLFRLAEGSYHLVAVANDGDNTAVAHTDAGAFESMYIQHPAYEGEGTIATHDHNYLGMADIHVPGQLEYVHETVEMHSAHINVDIEIHGLPAPTKAAEGYVLSIENANMQTGFNNAVRPEATGTVTPALVYDDAAGVYRTDGLALFRMDSGGTLDAALCRHQMVLDDANGREVARFPLYEYITANGLAAEAVKQEAYLPVSLTVSTAPEGDAVSVTIEVPSWYVEEVLPGWRE